MNAPSILQFRSVNPVALTAHSFVVVAGMLLGLSTVLPWAAAITLGIAGSIAVVGALVVGALRRRVGRHHAVGGDISLLQMLLWQEQAAGSGRHRRLDH